jgi:hypothetical protein
MPRLFPLCLLLFPVVVPSVCAKGTTRLGVRGTRFTINGRPTFLLGISYYGALGAPEKILRQDLARMRRLGFNWVRVWATWAAFDNDFSAVDREGRARPGYLKKLRRFVAACDSGGLVVDVTLARGNGVNGPPRLQSLEAHRRAVTTLTRALRAHGNWYLDLANERNVRDKRFTSMADLKELRRRIRKLDPRRLVTASHAGDLSRADLHAYLGAGLDFLAPHRPRQVRSPGQTEAKTREYIAWMKEGATQVPVLYQEPFRRGFGAWQPGVEDYLTDLRGARAGGAAGWCFHNGDQRNQGLGRPRRGFDLRDQGLFAQLDGVEQKVLLKLGAK